MHECPVDVIVVTTRIENLIVYFLLYNDPSTLFR
jgi:hypothetical protein